MCLLSVCVVPGDCGQLWYKRVETCCFVMLHAQKTDFIFRHKESFHSNRRGRRYNRLLAAVLILVTACSEVVWKLPAIHCIRQFPLHFPFPASPCAIKFELESYGLGANCLKTETNISSQTYFFIEDRKVKNNILCQWVINLRQKRIVLKFSRDLGPRKTTEIIPEFSST